MGSVSPVQVAGKPFGGDGAPLFLIAGPCVIEDEPMARRIARFLADLCARLAVPFIFKASYDKANRT
ncbi:MAG: 3-deoxy-8-phosphooctulonate synthase, partial [Planctomycetes bacterium]|nr:3-deoxy-8-phosphooctulonate synthase [Planctomycetota bacterium]